VLASKHELDRGLSGQLIRRRKLHASIRQVHSQLSSISNESR